MSNLNTNYSTQLYVMSPVHIGAGKEKDWVRGVDFIHHDDKVYVLDLYRMYSDLDEQEQDDYTALLASGTGERLESFIIRRFDLDEYSRYCFDYAADFRGKEIKTMLRNGAGEPYIPGSSIKGAIASAIVGYLHREAGTRIYNKEMYGEFGTSLGRFIRPYDSGPVRTDLSDVELYNLYRQGHTFRSDKKHGFGFVVESAVWDTQKSLTSFRLSLADGLGLFLQNHMTGGEATLPRKYHSVFDKRPLEALFHILNESARYHLEQELAFFREYSEYDRSDLIIEQIQDFLATIDNFDGRTALLRMSSGSGFHSITGDYRFSDHFAALEHGDRDNMIFSFKTRQKEPARYKSRRIVFPYKGLMGFVKLAVH